MRHVEISLRSDSRDPILEVLEAKSIDYTVVSADEDSEYAALVTFTLPKNAVETVLDELRDAGLDEEDHTVIVTADMVISRRFGDFKEGFENRVLGDERLDRRELYADADALIPTIPVYVTMTLLSSIVATAGLLLDSPAVVVGSMVIAPLIGPALAASVGTVLDETELFLTGIKYQALGIGVAVVGATAFAWLAKSLFLVPPGVNVVEIEEVGKRFLPDLLSLFVAFGAGIAGVLSLATGLSTALVGVMIAAALIPPAAATGIAIAWGIPTAAVGSIVLVFVNFLGINITGLLALWSIGYRPEVWGEAGRTRLKVRRHIVVFAVATIVLSTFLVGVTWASYERATLENDISAEAETVLESPAYRTVYLLDVELFLEQGVPFEPAAVLEEGDGFDGPQRVVISVEQPVGDSNPDLASALSEKINRGRGAEITVHVRFTEYDTA
ncbi:TIGR00341 family protein [Natrinema caseinilyticum]|uniref:TIGR00341 family protein n=1 Tax=Natrinema caseinilyticum TaxID=2961570 RepID=UPI0020C454B0|nr:TIGR00341 family protein [Natrinema caseinilyticum]